MANTSTDHQAIRDLDEQGVPRPDGTALGNLAHVLALYSDAPDDREILSGTRGVYGQPTGLTLGDLRTLKVEIDILHGIVADALPTAGAEAPASGDAERLRRVYRRGYEAGWRDGAVAGPDDEPVSDTPDPADTATVGSYLPPDRVDDDRPCCLHESLGGWWRCTRPAGHSGQHVALVTSGRVVGVWLPHVAKPAGDDPSRGA